jgi:endonuclease YncB( thermonuclease family)
MNSITKLLTALAVLICFSAVAAAATLQAKVTSVPSGNTLVVSNTSRSVRIRLKAILPPEAGQPFSEAARDHLKALVFDQTVLVDYTHLTDHYLEARVFLNGIDIGSQMLRDGVAWYDHETDYELTEGDRDLYTQCEQAARAEKRGLWHDESPVAPWEYRRMQQEKAESTKRSYGSLSNSKVRTRDTVLSNQDLMISSAMSRNSSASASNGGSNGRPIVENGSFSRWTNFESPLGHFSVLVPSNAVHNSATAADGQGRPVNYELLAAGSDQVFLTVVSSKGPNDNRDDASVLDQTVQSMIAGMNDGARKSGTVGQLSVKPVREMKLADYVGKQFSISGDVFSGTVRVFTKRIGEERQIILAFALTRAGSESLGNQFLNSFKITQ